MSRILIDFVGGSESALQCKPQAWKFLLDNLMDARNHLGESELLIAGLNGRLVGTVTLYPDVSCSSQEACRKA